MHHHPPHALPLQMRAAFQTPDQRPRVAHASHAHAHVLHSAYSRVARAYGPASLPRPVCYLLQLLSLLLSSSSSTSRDVTAHQNPVILL